LGVTIGLSIFFSKQIFDIFVTPSYGALEKPREKK
jgi:hypothetical protein